MFSMAKKLQSLCGAVEIQKAITVLRLREKARFMATKHLITMAGDYPIGKITNTLGQKLQDESDYPPAAAEVIENEDGGV
jgi:hypothetical protein